MARGVQCFVCGLVIDESESTIVQVEGPRQGIHRQIACRPCWQGIEFSGPVVVVKGSYGYVVRVARSQLDLFNAAFGASKAGGRNHG